MSWRFAVVFYEPRKDLPYHAVKNSKTRNGGEPIAEDRMKEKNRENARHEEQNQALDGAKSQYTDSDIFGW